MLCTLHKLRSFYVRALPVDAFPRLLAHTLALDLSTKPPTQSLRCRPMVVSLRIGLRAHAGPTAKLHRLLRSSAVHWLCLRELGRIQSHLGIAHVPWRETRWTTFCIMGSDSRKA